MSASDWTDPEDVAAMAEDWKARKAARTAAHKVRRRLRARTGLTRIPAEWLDAALALPCAVYLAEIGGVCGRRPTRLYLRGRRCWEHAPIAITPIRKDTSRG